MVLIEYHNRAVESQQGRGMQVAIKQKVKVWITSIIGAIPAVVVRDMTGDESAARTANPLHGEGVFEVRFIAGQHRGAYNFVPARDLRPA